MVMDDMPLAGALDIDSDTDSDAAPASVARDRLYRLWEDGNWRAKAIDLAPDAVDWQTKLDDHTRAAILWNAALFLDGEESVTVTLAPFMTALTDYEDRVFLATQIADEARHHVFFDRFLREVAGIGHDFASTLDLTKPNLTWGYRQVFAELDRVTDRIRRHPKDLPLLAQGFALYHLTVEAMLAHTGQHYLRAYCEREQLFPGFREGVNLIARDESRHIAFGIQALRSLVMEHPECKAAAINIINKVLPWAAGVFVPPGQDWRYITAFGYTPVELFTFALRSFTTKLRRAGIAPNEVLELVKLGADDSPADQAARVLTLVEAGVIGTNEEPRPSEPVMAELFAATRRVAAWARPAVATPRLTLQWIFEGAAPRYLEFGGDEEPRDGVGMAPMPHLILRCAAADWLRVAGKRLDSRVALASRRLRISGDWRLALRLNHLLPL